MTTATVSIIALDLTIAKPVAQEAALTCDPLCTTGVSNAHIDWGLDIC